VYTPDGIGNAIGSVYGACNCPPSNTFIDGEFWQLMIPLLVAPGALSFGMVAFPIGFVLAAASLFRWKLMVVAGALSLLSGVVWILGIFLVQPEVVHGLDTWYGYAGGSVTSSVWAPIGPYMAVVGGTILLLGYALSRREILEYPLD
jgi:hypothetical protein